MAKLTKKAMQEAEQRGEVEQVKWPDPGIYLDIPEDAYHACEHMSRTDLTLIAQCPSKWEHRKQFPWQATDDQLEGTATHYCLLQPELYDQKVVAREKPDLRKKGMKDLWAGYEQEAMADGKILITKDVEDRIVRMRDKLWTHPAAKDYLSSGTPEVTLVFDEAMLDIRCKMRVDWVVGGTNILVDLKTARSAHPAIFTREIFKWNYHVQASFYRTGWEQIVAPVDEFVFLVVEKTAPYPVTVVTPTIGMLMAGERIWVEGMHRYRTSLEQGRFADYTDEVVVADCPDWMLNAESDDGEGDDENHPF